MVTISPLLKDCSPSFPAAGSTPKTSRPWAEMAVPASRPPPPKGTTIVATSGHSFTISSAAVPAPAMIRSSSNGGTTVAPIFPAISRATVSRVAEVTPAETTFAPYAWVASTFERTEFSGMTMVAGMPRRRAARATPWAWLPEENATTPHWRCDSSSWSSAFIAPRILNEPARCRFSHLRRTSTPILSESEALASSGVRWIQGAMRVAAARTAERSTMVLTFGELTCRSINSCRLFD
jgi:hypothetical protein